mgnify:CR=1 FL=1
MYTAPIADLAAASVSIVMVVREFKIHGRVTEGCRLKTGFFPGAHGIPDVSRLQDDGDSRNIELPYSQVNHLKVSTRQSLLYDKWALTWDIGFQKNHREEWSRFHTHYDAQPVPDKDPDKELAFTLNTIVLLLS